MTSLLSDGDTGFTGYMKTTRDAILITLAARFLPVYVLLHILAQLVYRSGLISRVTRRLTTEECHSRIKSGTIIVYSSKESGR